MNVLVLSPFVPSLRDSLVRDSAAWPDVRWTFAASLRELPSDISDVDVLVTFSLPPSLIERLPRVSWISSTGAGVDRILHPSLPPHVVVTRMVGPFGRPIAEYVLAAILADAQDHARTARAQATHTWEPFYPREVASQTVAVLGAGAIGREVAALLRAVGLRVIGLRRSGGFDAAFDAMFDAAHLDEFLQRADVLVLLTPLTDDTRGLIGAHELGTLPEHALVINVARGAVIDEAALIAALSAGHPRAAVLDVFATEPLPADHALWAMPQVRITPHIAGLTRVGDIVACLRENIDRYRMGRPLLHVVDRARGY